MERIGYCIGYYRLPQSLYYDLYVEDNYSHKKVVNKKVFIHDFEDELIKIKEEYDGNYYTCEFVY